jgi:hypothetical protein
MHFQSNHLTIWFKFFHRCVDLGKILKNEIYLFIFIWTKYEKYNNGQSWVLLYGTRDDVK